MSKGKVFNFSDFQVIEDMKSIVLFLKISGTDLIMLKYSLGIDFNL